MKIGICTQPLNVNYGGILQNYALQTVLKRMGHEVWTLDYYIYTWIGWFAHSIKVFLFRLLGSNREFMPSPRKRRMLETPLRRFVYNNISLTTPRTRWFSRHVVLKYDLDVIIVGSDQTWRPAYNANIKDLYLDFLRSDQIKRIAYACSFGTDEWEYSPQQTNECSFLVRKFDAISVREKSGVDLCKKYFNIEATHVLDPTMLLSFNDYNRLCENISPHKPFVFAYILDTSDSKIQFVKDFAREKKLPYYIMNAGLSISSNDSIEKWLSCFRDAAFIITDSFHGTVFSILYKTDFYVFGNIDRGNSRFYSLLNLFDLSNRIITNYVTSNQNIDLINWGKVESILETERKKSIQFILSNL